jgi:hypothetical protein
MVGRYIPYSRVEHCKFVILISLKDWPTCPHYFYKLNVGMVAKTESYQRVRETFTKLEQEYVHIIEQNGGMNQESMERDSVRSLMLLVKLKT